MREGVTPQEAHNWLDDYFKERPDLGLSNVWTSLALEPRNPFAPGARCKPRVGFVIAAILFAAALAWIAFFNFLA